MSKIRITTFSRTPQLFVRLETVPLRPTALPSVSTETAKKASDADRESKSRSSLKRIENNQELTLKTLEKLQKELSRVSALETMVADLHAKEREPVVEEVQKPFPPVKHSASCDACLGDIIGHRFKCLECADYDLCEKCERKSLHYEHAMIRIVEPKKTMIPSYVTSNSPNNVFPTYMQHKIQQPQTIKGINKTVITRLVPSHQVNPAPMPQAPPVSTPVPFPPSPTIGNGAVPKPAQEPRIPPSPTSALPPPQFFNEETRAAIINSAALLKETFSTLSRSFLDLADGAQANMDKKIIERSTMEAGMTKFEEKMDNLKRHCEEKYLGTETAEAEKSEESSKKQADSLSGPKIKKAKKKSCYKKSAERLFTMQLAAAAAEQARLEQEAKKRAEASSAELQRKLAELNVKESQSKSEENIADFVLYDLYGNSLEALLRGRSSSRIADPPTTPNTEPATTELASTTSATPAVTAPASIVPVTPTAPIVETLIVPPLPPVESNPEEVTPMVTAPISIHSSFENISSDFESLSPSWGGYPDLEAAQRLEVIDDNLLDFSDVAVEAQEAQEAQEEARPEPEQSLPPFNEETEKVNLNVVHESPNLTNFQTFDRLLEMGFSYNVTVAAIRANGSNLEMCLQALLH